MKTLRLASFGMRGFVGTSLTPRVIIDFGCAFGSYVDGGRVLLARDTRYSSPMIHSAVLSSLLSTGCEVIDFGVCPTPVLQHCVKNHEAAGAVSISGGHNSMGWNAITLIDAQGALLEPSGGEHVLELFHAGDFKRADWNSIGSVRREDGFFTPYLDALEAQVNIEAIRRANFTVLIDPAAGAGCAYIFPFAERFNLKLVPLNAEPSGYLAREAEPRPRSASQLAAVIGHVNGDAGFVFSSELGRMSLVTETGEPASEENTFAIIANHILGKTSGTLVTNCCTSRTIDDIAREKGAPLLKVRVGQAYLVSALKDEQGLLGGEGSGSVVLPSFSWAYDGFLMMSLVLESMAESGESLSALFNNLPRYHIVKRDHDCGANQAYYAVERIKDGIVAELGEGEVDYTDGIRVDWEDGWVHVRPSRTQQMVRVISESYSREKARRRADDVILMIEQGV